MLKLRLLSSMFFCCLLLVCSGSSFAQSPEAITESDVVALINSVDQATKKKNLEGILAPLASDIKIKLVVSTPGRDKEEVVHLNKEQLAEITKRTLRQRFAYTLERKNTRVKLYDDNKTAMVTSNLYETVTTARGKFRAVSAETSVVTLRDGKLLFISVETRIRFY